MTSICYKPARLVNSRILFRFMAFLIFMTATGTLSAQVTCNTQSLYAWGNGFSGQTGTGILSPLKIGTATNWQSISAGQLHTAALKSDGTLWTCGNNDFGQLGNNLLDETLIPTKVGTATNWKSISAGSLHTVALKTDGTLWAWGYNTDGELGDGTTTNKKIPVKIGTATDWKIVKAGQSHTIALKTDGTLWAWGDNSFGQLGNGTHVNRTSPVRIGTATNWKDISVGSSHTVAIKTDGTLWAWGYNVSGQIGDGTTNDRLSPVKIGTATNWTQFSAGFGHNLALRSDGTLWAWGENNNGGLGDGTKIQRTTPIKIGTATNWQSVSAGYLHSVALKTDGTLWVTGYNRFGQLGNGTTTDGTTFAKIGTAINWKSISSYFHTLALRTDGTLWAWGGNSEGNLGNGTKSLSTNVPVSQIGTEQNWKTISAGENHSMAIKTNGTLWAWGNNGLGELGNNALSRTEIPVQIGTTTWKNVSAGRGSTLAINTDGTLWAWGNNNKGQLGDGTFAQRRTPVKIGTDTDWATVATNDGHTVALKTNGTLWAWGDNSFGQLGNGSAATHITRPVKIGTATNWKSITLGQQHTLAIRTDGTLWAWGSNRAGQLGDGTQTDHNVPVKVGTATNWKSVSAGRSHTVALKTDGSLWGSGYNFDGELGNGKNGGLISFTKNTVTDNQWNKVISGNLYCIGLKNDGTLWAWGLNAKGQLGDGTAPFRLSPIRIGSAANWSDISAGYEHALAVSCATTANKRAFEPLLALEGRAELNRIRIDWVVNNGQNIDYFNLDKLNEATGLVDKLTTLNNTKPDNGLQNHTFYDENPNEGDNHYRLTIVHADGTESISPIKTIRYNPLGKTAIFPNPAQDYIDIDLALYKEESVGIFIYNPMGTIVATQQVPKADKQPTHIDLNHLPDGQYLVRIVAKGQKDVTKQIVIMK